MWGYKAIYQMEVDVHPIRTGWLNTLVDIINTTIDNDLWVVGGSYNVSCMSRRAWSAGSVNLIAEKTNRRLDGNWWDDGHINGNAIYVADLDFRAFVLANLKCTEDEGYDYFLFERGVEQSMREKWKMDDRFMNCKPNGDDKMLLGTSPARFIKD